MVTLYQKATQQIIEDRQSHWTSEKCSVCFHSTDIPTVKLLLILYFEFLMFLQEGKNLGLQKFNFHTDYNKKKI